MFVSVASCGMVLMAVLTAFGSPDSPISRRVVDANCTTPIFTLSGATGSASTMSVAKFFNVGHSSSGGGLSWMLPDPSSTSIRFT
jgi:hypothetical protein